jgi:D-glycero-D-manno-heptose 1,7-bisphosphate phosphatase
VSLRRAAFLDRDGTLIRDRDYLSDPAGVELIPGTVEGLRALRDAGLALVVVTNQSGIARGLYSEADYHRVAARLDEILESHGVRPDLTLFCPHHPDHGGPCSCRKPETGMHLRAARELGLDPGRSFFVGDKVSDVEAGRRLGGQGILVLTGYGRDSSAHVPVGTWIAEDVADAARRIVAEGGFSSGAGDGFEG